MAIKSSRHNSKTKSKNIRSLMVKNKLVLFVVFFAAIASTILIVSHAAVPTVSVEPENGALATQATLVNDSAASGGKAVQFKAASSVDPRCASGGSFLWSNLESCGWAGPSNTGPDLSQCPGGVLTNNSGATTRTITISTANTTISCQNITGGLVITAQNVTIKNSKVAWDGGGAGGHGVITINDGASATIDHVDTDGLNHTHACIFNSGVKGGTLAYSAVIKSVNCHNVNDGFFSWWWSSDTNAGAGSDFIIQDRYLHDFTQNAANGHIDGYQTEGAQNGTITHNTFHMNEVPNDVQVSGGGMDSALALWDDYNATSPVGKNTTNFNISNNLIAGGGFSIYAEDRSPSSTDQVGGDEETQIHVTNNKFSTIIEGGCVGSFGVWFYRGPGLSSANVWPPYYGGPTDGWNQGGSTRTGNVILESGTNVDGGNPTVGGKLCA